MGLINQQKQRVNILRRLFRYISRTRLKIMAKGIFYLKLVNCLVFGLVTAHITGNKCKENIS